MAIRRISAVLLTVIIAVSLGVPAMAGSAPLRTPPVKYISAERLSACTREVKTYTYDTGDALTLVRSVFTASARRETGHAMTVSLAGSSGTVTYIGNDGSFRTVPLTEGMLPSAVLFFETDAESLVLGPGALYRRLGDGILRDCGMRQSVWVTKGGGGYQLTVRFARLAGCEAQLWWLRSKSSLVEWDSDAVSLWTRLNFNGTHRLCFDGAYYAAASGYLPYVSNSFYRCPAVHPATVLLDTAGDLAAELSYYMLDTILAYQNADGWWPMPLQSRWLFADYGIASGFYDTRFNNDLIVSLFKAAQSYDEPRFKEAAISGCDWLLDYSERYSTEVSGHGFTGILVEDYCPADGSRGFTHTSLNHQLQEMKALLSAYSATGKAEYRDMMRRMLNGIKATEPLWVHPEEGLVYALLDGSPVGSDYPYLTYNDLYEFQQMLHERDGALDRLMASKRSQMERSGITGYYN